LPIKLERARHTFVIAIPSEPQQVRFDPGARVLHKLEFDPGDTMLRSQLTGAPDVIGRILAANELAKSGRRAAIEAIAAAYASEKFWGVRERFLRALAKANSEAAITALADIVRSERNPMVLEAVFDAAAEYRDPRIRDAVSARILERNLPPLAAAAAYRAMGAQRQDADWDLLMKGAQQIGYHGFAQAGALRGLAATRREAVAEYLIEHLAYGRLSNRVRPQATLALSEIGRGLEKGRRERVVETLTDLLRDPWERVRSRAADGLRSMEATEALAALDAWSRRLSHQERIRAEELIAGLRQADKSDGSAVKKQVEELREKVRKLEDQVQKMEARLEPAAEAPSDQPPGAPQTE
jgi:HEAT repeat protein